MAVPTKKKSPARRKAPGKKDYTMLKWGVGLFVLIVGVFLLVSVVSYYFSWAADQDIAQWRFIGERPEGRVHNKGDVLGAIAADFIVGKNFGFFGICFPLILMILGLRILDWRPAKLRKSVHILVITMLLGSLATGYVFGSAWGIYGTGIGGAQGIYMSDWLGSKISGLGAGLVILMLVILFAIYININTIKLLKKVGHGVVDNAMKAGEYVSQKAGDYIQTLKQEKDEPEPADDLYERGDLPPFDVDEEEEPEEEAIEEEVRFDTREYLDSSDEFEEDPPFVVDEEPEKDPRFRVHSLGGGDGFREPVQPKYQTPYTGGGAFAVLDAEGNPVGAGSAVELEVDTGVEEELLEEDQIDYGFYDPTLDLSSYQRPPVTLLDDHAVNNAVVTPEEIAENEARIVRTLENFSITIDKIKATIGPTVTLYEIVPAPGIRISKIQSLEKDIALSLSALGIRIIAPMPGKGTIGIEVPNKNKQVVSMLSVVRSQKFQESEFDLPIVLGKTIQGEIYMFDLARMPHLLVAGATGQGKSVGLNAIIASLLFKRHPSELKFVLIDPKKVELSLYSRLEKHFLAKYPTEEEAIITDTQKVIATLNSLCIEMDSRYDLLKKAKVKTIKEYNEKFRKRHLNPENGHRFMPYIVLIVDEFADMIMTAGREIETPIARLTQLARAVGIHLVIATQRPSTNIITGLIKANFPARIAFKVTNSIDSKVILDQSGAQQLIGRGDMLVSNGGELTRVQCAFIDTPEIERIAEFIGEQRGYGEAYELPEFVPDGETALLGRDADLSNRDPLFDEVARHVVISQQGSTSTIQRRFSIGYNRAGRIMDQLERAGVVGKGEGSKPRQVLVQDLTSLELLLINIP